MFLAPPSRIADAFILLGCGAFLLQPETDVDHQGFRQLSKHFHAGIAGGVSLERERADCG